ncbi:MAG: ribosome small subunit-dependent GTPase A [candidate division Zixibacteria bacterium]|nr:ribosome small subunit-dependent GTPase A [candidate division Zixibacteria bacterium]
MDTARQYDGRVIKSFGKRFIVQTSDGTFDCELRGRFRLTSEDTVNPVAVGDRVAIAVETPPYGVIEEIHERRNKLSRPEVIKPFREQILVANCDQLIVVGSVTKPKLKLGAIDRFLLGAENNGMQGVVVVNKVDLGYEKQMTRARDAYTMAGYPCIATSADSGEGIDELRELVKLKTSMFCGHSGVGKSSLVNALQPGLHVETGEISESTGKGTHTTTTIELHPLDFGGYIVDTPGLRVIGIWDLTQEDLPDLYPEFRSRADDCKFRNCMHIGEPDCAVREAVEAGEINRERYDGYLRIRDTLELRSTHPKG